MRGTVDEGRYGAKGGGVGEMGGIEGMGKRGRGWG